MENKNIKFEDHSGNEYNISNIETQLKPASNQIFIEKLTMASNKKISNIIVIANAESQENKYVLGKNHSKRIKN